MTPPPSSPFGVVVVVCFPSFFAQSILCVRQRLWFLRFLIQRSAYSWDASFIYIIAVRSLAVSKAREVFWYWLRLIIYQSLGMTVSVDEVGGCMRSRVGCVHCA